MFTYQNTCTDQLKSNPEIVSELYTLGKCLYKQGEHFEYSLDNWDFKKNFTNLIYQ